MPNLQATCAKAKAFWHECVTRSAPARDKLHHQFIDHPEEAGESYIEHLIFTIKMAFRLVFVGIVLLIHGVFPFLLVRTGSSQMEAIWHILEKRKKVCAENVAKAHEAATVDALLASE